MQYLAILAYGLELRKVATNSMTISILSLTPAQERLTPEMIITEYFVVGFLQKHRPVALTTVPYTGSRAAGGTRVYIHFGTY